jgi:hypothetical protein
MAYGTAIAPATTVGETFTFTNVTQSPLMFDVEIDDNRVLVATTHYVVNYSAGQIVDTVTNQDVGDLADGVFGDHQDSMSYSIAITPDARLIAGERTAGVVASFDMITGQKLLSTKLRPQKSHVPSIYVDPTGSVVYAVVCEGHPQGLYRGGSSAGECELVRMDVASLTVNARLALGVAKNRSMAISPDGKLMVLTTQTSQGGVIIVDLTTFTEKTRLMPQFRANIAKWSPDGTHIALVGEFFQIWDLEGNSGTQYVTPDPAGGKVVTAIWPTANDLWIGRGRGNVYKCNTNDGTSTMITTLYGEYLEMYDGELYTYYQGDTMLGTTPPYGLARMDPANTLTPLQVFTGFTRLTGHGMARSPF